ncbi:hypothetical protein AB1N83_000664 [Pleurotus pulmonarius]
MSSTTNEDSPKPPHAKAACGGIGGLPIDWGCYQVEAIRVRFRDVAHEHAIALLNPLLKTRPMHSHLAHIKVYHVDIGHALLLPCGL